MTETLIVQELAYIFAQLCEGEKFSYLLSLLRKISYNLGKTEIFRIFSSSIYLPNNTRAKEVDVIFTFKHSLLNPRTNYETMDSVLVLGPDIQDTDIQAQVKKN